MSRTGWERWAPASGIVFVALFVAGLLVVGDSPGSQDSDAEILGYYADRTNRIEEITAVGLAALGVLFLLVFLSALRTRLAAAEAEPRSVSALAYGAGVASATLLMAAAAAGGVISGTVQDTDLFELDADVARLVMNASYLLLVASGMLASVLVAATSALAIRTAVLPRWLGWVGLIVALALVVSVFFFPILAFWLWVLVVSVVLVVRPPVPAGEQTGASTAP